MKLENNSLEQNEKKKEDLQKKLVKEWKWKGNYQKKVFKK